VLQSAIVIFLVGSAPIQGLGGGGLIVLTRMARDLVGDVRV
jgi:hypothetical protein